MIILAIDTSGPCAGAAVYKNDKVVSHCWNENGHTHSDTIVSRIDHALESGRVLRNELEAIAVTVGPGSFTGLRIGVSIAKAMAQALSIPCIPVDTLETLCYMARPGQLRCAIMDARRNEVYSRVERGEEIILSSAGRPLAEVIETLKSIGEPVVFSGDGVRVYGEIIKNQLGDKANFVPEPFVVQQAAAVAMIAAATEQAQWLDAFTLEPNYLRLSQAEREALTRG